MEALTIPALRQAIETRDGKTLAGFYNEDAVMRIVDAAHPPSDPLEIKGAKAIAAYYEDVCGRTMTHSVDNAVAEGDRLAFVQTCTYPDGKRVCCSAMLELRGGKIVRQTAVQAWDS